MFDVVCFNCQIPASVIIQSDSAGVALDQMRCGTCGSVWTVPQPVGSRSGVLMEPYARRRPDRRAQPRG
jgi:predicted Zn finger-like uncharacterized protein